MPFMTLHLHVHPSYLELFTFTVPLAKGRLVPSGSKKKEQSNESFLYQIRIYQIGRVLIPTSLCTGLSIIGSGLVWQIKGR